jgi:hypothetical protein
MIPYDLQNLVGFRPIMNFAKKEKEWSLKFVPTAAAA